MRVLLERAANINFTFDLSREFVKETCTISASSSYDKLVRIGTVEEVDFGQTGKDVLTRRFLGHNYPRSRSVPYIYTPILFMSPSYSQRASALTTSRVEIINIITVRGVFSRKTFLGRAIMINSRGFILKTWTSSKIIAPRKYKLHKL